MKRICKKLLSVILVVVITTGFTMVSPIEASAATGSWADYRATGWVIPATGTIAITTAAQLAQLAYNVNTGVSTYANRDIILANDIDLSAHNWVPMGTDATKPFQGKIDGQSNSIIGLTINRLNTANVGFIGYASQAVIKNLNLTGGSVASTYNTAKSTPVCVGSLLGYGDDVTIGSITSSVPVTNTVTSTDYGFYTGGLVGYVTTTNTSTTEGGIVNSSSSCTVTVTFNVGSTAADQSMLVGGFVGGIDGPVKIQNCFSTSSLSLSGNRIGAGGFAGMFRNTSALTGGHILDSYATGAITYNTTGINAKCIGGFVSAVNNSSGTIGNCYAVNTITASGTATATNIGGFASRVVSGTIDNIYAAPIFTSLPTTGNIGQFAGEQVGGTLSNWMFLQGSYQGVGNPAGGTRFSRASVDSTTLQNNANINDSNSTYNGQKVLAALNTEKTESGGVYGRNWRVSSDVNNGYPYFGFYVAYFDEVGGTDVTDIPFAQYGTAITQTSTKPGYIFSGWYSDAAYTGSPVTTVTADYPSTAPLYAKWVPLARELDGTVWCDSNENGKIDSGEVAVNTTVKMQKLGSDGTTWADATDWSGTLLSTSINSTGNYSFNDIPPGQYRVLVPISNSQTRPVKLKSSTLPIEVVTTTSTQGSYDNDSDVATITDSSGTWQVVQTLDKTNIGTTPNTNTYYTHNVDLGRVPVVTITKGCQISSTGNTDQGSLGAPVTVTYGDTINYTLTVTNNSTLFATGANTITVTDALPDGLIYVPLTGTVPPTTVNGQDLTWSGLPSIPASGSYAITVTARVTKPNVDISNTAHAVEPDGTDTPSNTTYHHSKGLDLTIGKLVTGDLADTQKAFTFNVTLGSSQSALLSGLGTAGSPYTYWDDLDGAGLPGGGTLAFGDAASAVQLKHGQGVTFHDLPMGINYTINETDNSGYMPSVSITNGTANAGTANTGSYSILTQKTEGQLNSNDATVKYANDKISVTPTGIFLEFWPYILTVLLAIGIAAGLFIHRIRTKKHTGRHVGRQGRGAHDEGL